MSLDGFSASSGSWSPIGAWPSGQLGGVLGEHDEHAAQVLPRGALGQIDAQEGGEALRGGVDAGLALAVEVLGDVADERGLSLFRLSVRASRARRLGQPGGAQTDSAQASRSGSSHGAACAEQPAPGQAPRGTGLALRRPGRSPGRLG